MPGHGAQISAPAPTKGYVQTGAWAPRTRTKSEQGHGHLAQNSKLSRPHANHQKSLYFTQMLNRCFCKEILTQETPIIQTASSVPTHTFSVTPLCLGPIQNAKTPGPIATNGVSNHD